MDWLEKFSRDHPLNGKFKDADVFLHGTSLKKYLEIKSSGFLRKNVSKRNYGISPNGVCFDKYFEKHGVAELSVESHWKTACRNDQSTEGVILQIKGSELKKLKCPIYADWNDGYPHVYDPYGIPVEVDTEASFLSIIVNGDVPFEYLEVVRRLPFKE